MNDSAGIGILDQFQTDLVATWRRVPNKSFFFVLLALWLALFQFLGNSTFGYVKSPSLLCWMYEAYSGGGPDINDRHGLVVPFVVLGLFWWKRNELLALKLKPWSPGLILVAAALGLHVIGYVIQQPRVSIVALFVGLYGLMGLAWGKDMLRSSIFPFFLFVFSIPVSTLMDPISVPLQIIVCRIVEFIAQNLLGIHVLRSGTQLYDSLGRYQYEVAAACSGIRSLVSIGSMAVIGAFLFYRSWWRRLALIASTVPLAVLGNVVRLLTIIISAELGGQKVGDYIHEGGPGGVISLLPYVPALLGLFTLGNWLSERKHSQPKPA